jgi:hypothetical protein
MKLADIIHDAIEHHLWDGEESLFLQFKRREHSCNAIRMFLGNELLSDHEWTSSIRKIESILRKYGCITSSLSMFSDIPYGHKRQYARALWLTFVELWAREEDIEI